MVDTFNPGTGRRGILERPGARVFQNFGPLAPTIVRPLLEAVIIGESYQIVDPAALAGLYNGALSTYSYPGLFPGATIIPGDTKVYIETIEDIFDITVGHSLVITASSVQVPASLVPERTLIDHAQITNIPAGREITDPNAAFVADNIRPGDILSFEAVPGDLVNIDSVVTIANTAERVITDILGDNCIELDQALTAELGKYEYTIVRRGTGSGEITVSYRALRSDGIDNLYEVESLEDLEEQLGLAVPENPLAYGMSLALQNTVNIVAGTPVLNNDSASEHQSATEFLESYEVYAMAPLTQNEGVFQIYKAHVTQMADPHEKKERMVFLNKEILDFDTYQDSSTTGGTDGLDGALFQDANAKFIENQVPIGSIIKLSVAIEFPDGGGNFVDELQILQINSETEVRLIDDAAVSLAGLTYTVQSKQYTKLQKAKNCKEFAEAFNDRRVVSLIPDEVEFPVGDTTQWLPGYFLGAVYAGLTSGTSPSQGFTNLPIVGPVGLRNSNRFFSETQMGTMAAGGNWIVVQESLQGPASARHQLTTQVNTIETREYSILKAIDYSAKFFRNSLRPLIGIFNITQDFIDNQLRPSVEGVLQDLKEEGVIGHGTHITGIEQDKNFKDNVNVFIAFEVLYPCNYINVILNL